MLKKLKAWHSGLSKAGKVILWSITAALVGSAINASASPNNQSTPKPTSSNQSLSQPSPKQSVMTTKTETETSIIAFSKTTVNDSGLAVGKTEVKTAGVNGEKTSTYEITYSDGNQTDKKLIKEETTKQPVTEVTAIGTYVAPVVEAPKPKPKSNCDPNYSGACVPNVYPSDVDCAGGSGNGPYYVQGPVYVIGTDRYGLDGNHDGIACQ